MCKSPTKPWFMRGGSYWGEGIHHTPSFHINSTPTRAAPACLQRSWPGSGHQFLSHTHGKCYHQCVVVKPALDIYIYAYMYIIYVCITIYICIYTCIYIHTSFYSTVTDRGKSSYRHSSIQLLRVLVICIWYIYIISCLPKKTRWLQGKISHFTRWAFDPLRTVGRGVGILRA